ncbi:MarR family winged helix-turn-helix transcriptional regulator [Actinomadura bangladeshensis]|uniref:MarR family transcriptional regulator n=1 Tax=Actinomadura bangladeshensis TaxID=453573 RepID=A0A4R4NQ66_9ACTN|nr:MarR family winged helix-turn-helix transcriptional regulator [Actinomadura bangladeshensis]TDC11708.1 MarR family transcriptional regulator [Actinomadura bangladeshensis]
MNEPATEPAVDVAARAWRNLGVVFHERNDMRRKVAEALGMSFFRAKALRRIAAAAEPLTLGDVAGLLLTDRPYATVVVDDLVGRGLVERAPNPADRRAKLVTATEAGRAAAAEAERILATPPPELYGLPAEDLAVLDRIALHLLGESTTPGGA